MWNDIPAVILSAFLFFSCNVIEAEERSLTNIEIKYIDLPTFKTGEKGPLLGRVVIKLHSDDLEPLTGRAVLEIESLKYRGEGTERLVYPGLYTALDFPVELKEPAMNNEFLDGILKFSIGDRFSVSRRVPVYIRKSGMFFRSYRSSVDDAVYPYALYLPDGLEQSSKKWPLVVSLHGAWSNYANNLKRLMGIGNREGEPDELPFFSLPIWPELPKVPGIVACPWGRGTMSYHGPGARDVLDVLEIIRRDYPIDSQRITVTGLSMGGNGTWEMALRYPDIWAAAAPVCPISNIETWAAVTDNLPEDKKTFPYINKIIKQNQISEWALNAKAFPVHIYHGNDDPVVPIAHSEDMVAALKKAGIEAPLTRFDNVGHNAWDPAYKNALTLLGLFQAERKKPQGEISFVTCRYENSRYEWLEIERFENYGDYARVDAEWRKETRELVLKTGNVCRLNIYPGELSEAGPGSKIKVVRGVKSLGLTVPAQGPLRLEIKKEGIAQASGPSVMGAVKRKGLEGPIYEALSSRVILVYGTKEGGGRRNLGELRRFADWGDLPDVHFLIKPDTLITKNDIESSHLVLFGDERTNSIITRINEKSPVRFDGSSVVAGKDRFSRDQVAFKCVFPNPLNPEKFVLLNFKEEWNYAENWSFQASFKLLPDYFIYRRGGDHPFATEVLKAGFFTDQWTW